MAGRDFDAEQVSTPREDPIWFKLLGKKWDCYDDVNGKRLFDNIALLDSENVSAQRDAVVQIFEDCIVEEQAEDFFARLDNPDTKVQLATLVEAAGWLAEAYTERPTKPPTDSRPTGANRGRTSTAKRTAKASTSPRSARRTT